MSKLFITVAFLALPFVACSDKKGKVEYVAPELELETNRIRALPDISAPEGARPALRLMYLMKIDKTMKVAMKAVEGSFVKVAVAADEDLDHKAMAEYLSKFEKELDAIMPEVMENYAVLYEKFYTDSELLELTQFYESQVGQKFIDNKTQMIPGATDIGRKLGEKIVLRLREK